MTGILLAALSSLFEEVSQSIGKREVNFGAESMYSFGFISCLFGAIIIIGEGVLRHSITFSLASLPTFLPRLVLEMVQAYVTVKAITGAQRSDYGLVRTLTIPLLLGIDLFLGYTIGISQIIGMALIGVTILTLVVSERARIGELGYVLVAAVNAAVTLSLYKYDISHFNSVEAEQGIILVALLVFFFFLARHSGENPFSLFVRPIFLAQGAMSGFSTLVISFAYVFAPASVVTAALRSSAVLWALASGRLYFGERQVLMKAALVLLVCIGVALLAIQF